MADGSATSGFGHRGSGSHARRASTVAREPAATRFVDIRRFDSIDSTNRYLLEAARAGAAEGTVAVADHQSAGRGRLGRVWLAPPGASLLTSVLLRPGPAMPLETLHLVNAAVALAAADACEAESGVAPVLKWPNDLLVGERKLAGVLAEADLEAGAVQALVVGIGINVNWPTELPEELAATAIALSHVAGRSIDRERLLAHVLVGLESRYARLTGPERRRGRREVASEYRRRCTTVGRPVRVELADETFTGTAADITDDGHLLVDVGTCLRPVVAGDVVHLRTDG